MKKTLFIGLLFLLCINYSWAQQWRGQQFANYNFESWRTETSWGTFSKKTAYAPNSWNSICTATGSLASSARSESFVKQVSGTRPGGTGSSYVQLQCVSILTVPANGSISTGRFNAGSMTAANVENCTYTSTGSGYNQAFTSYPDAVAVWVKTSLNSGNSRFNFVLHSGSTTSVGISNAIYRDPSNNSTNDGKEIAHATCNFNTGGNWERKEVPFEYTGNTDAPAYILATLSSNEIAGGGKAGDKLYFDDIELIYNTQLLCDEDNSIVIGGYEVYDWDPNSSTYDYDGAVCAGNWPDLDIDAQSAHATVKYYHQPTAAEPYVTFRIEHKNQESTVYSEYRLNYTNVVTPSLSIASTASSVCSGGSATLTASGASSYKWEDNSTTNPRTVNPTTTTTYTVTGTSNGCTATASYTVTVKETPAVKINNAIAGNSSICDGSSATLTASGATSYTWENSSTTNPRTVNPTAATTYTVTGTTNGCSATASHTVTVNSLPTIAISGTTAFCKGVGTTLTASGAQNYQWTGGPNKADYQVNPTENTTYTVTGTDANGCSNTASQAVTVKASPEVAISGANAVCAGNATELTASGATSYQWTGGPAQANYQVTPSENTTYTVTGTTDGCSATATYTVAVNALPTITISGTTAFCKGVGTTLTAGGAQNYQWTDGPNKADYQVNPTENTTYTVTGTDANGCSNTASQTVTVKSLPEVAISGDDAVCLGNSTELTASGATSYQWTGGPAQANYQVTPSGNTTYTVTGTTDGCSATATFTVAINDNPTITINGEESICEGETSTLTASGADSYVWNGQTPGEQYDATTTGDYTVVGTDANGCTGTATIHVTVKSLPVVTIEGADAVCDGASTDLTAQGATSYKWEDNSDNEVLNVTPVVETTYIVTGTTNGCSATATHTVSVKSLPVVTISGDDAVCDGASTELTASGADSYQWTGGPAQATYEVTPSANTTYAVTGTTDGCSATATFTVAINDNPTITITGEESICEGETSTLTASGADSYVWNGQTPGEQYDATTTGDYTVVGTDANGCTGTATIHVTVKSLPVVTISGADAVCDGASTDLTAQGATSYQWEDNSDNEVLNVTPVVETTYTVTGTTNGCSATATHTVAVNTNPTITITGEESICEGETSTLTASGADSYVWNGQTPGEQYDATTAGDYTVVGTDANGCTGTETMHITVKSLPNVSIDGTDAVCEGETTDLIAQGADSYEWTNGPSEALYSVTPSKKTTYTVTGTTDGCSATATHTVDIHTNPTIGISGEESICEGETSTLTASGAVSYIWNNLVEDDHIDVTVDDDYSVVGTDANGCTGTATIHVTVKTLPMVTISGADAVCDGASTELTASGADSYQWTGGPAQANYQVTPSGNTTYTVTGTTNGCSATATFTVAINTNPTITITGEESICEGETSTLTASGADSYIWDGQTPGEQYDATTTGDYTVVGTDDNGCTGTATIHVTVKSLPVVTISGADAVCDGASTELTASGADSYVWDDQSSNATIEVTPTVETIYTVTGTTEGCSATATHTVAVNTNPTITITGEESICDGETSTLVASGAISYVWNGQTPGEQYEATATDDYTVEGTDANGCTGTATIHVTIKPLPKVSIDGAEAVCAGESTVLTAHGADSYEWTNGPAQAIYEVTPSEKTTYTVTGTTDGCSATATYTVAVNAIPDVKISGKESIYNGQSTTLTASGADSYEWDDKSTTNPRTVNPTTTTQYEVVGTTLEGCSASATHTVTVEDAPAVSIDGVESICFGESADLRIISSATEYTWSTGEKTETIHVSPTVTTTYNVVADVDGLAITATHTVVVKSLPNVTIEGETAVCDGKSTKLTATGADTYVWKNKDSNAEITVYPTAETMYQVTGYVDGCAATASVTVTVNANPTVEITGNEAICDGEQTTLTASGAVNYIWNGQIESNHIDVTLADDYNVVGTDANGCTGTATMHVVVRALPKVVISGDDAVCDGASTTLRADGADSYEWTNGPAQSDYEVTPTATTTYTVTGTTDGCSATATFTVAVKVLPKVTIEGETAVCDGKSTILTAKGADSYEWTNGPSTAEYEVAPEKQAVYEVTATTDGCSATATYTVDVYTNPTITIAGDEAICDGEQTTLTASGAVSYIWNGQIEGDHIDVTLADDYTVVGTDANGCTGTATMHVVVRALPKVVISGDEAVCDGASTTLRADGADSYEWTNGPSQSDYEVTPTEATTYTVTGTTDGCSATATFTVAVKALPKVTIEGETAVCDGKSTILTAKGAESYEWTEGPSTAEYEVTPGKQAVYEVTGTTEGCSATASFTVDVYANPVVEIFGEESICDGDSTKLTATGAKTYMWNNQMEGNFVIVTLSDDYTVVGADENGCTSTATMHVTVKALPKVAIDGADAVCEGNSTKLIAYGATDYEWTNGPAQADYEVSPTEATTYTVKGTTEGCSATASITVAVNAYPVVTVDGKESVYAGQEVTLTAHGAAGYVWTNFSSTDSTLTDYPTTTTTYEVTGITNDCATTATYTVNVKEMPTLQIDGTDTICAGETVKLTVVTIADDFIWSTNETSLAISVTPDSTTTYSVTATIGKTAMTTTHTVYVIPMPTVTIEGEEDLCKGDSAVLTAVGSFENVAWNNGLKTARIEVGPESNTEYSVIASNNKCTATASFKINVVKDCDFICGRRTLYDADSNEYATTKAGGICWMAENLRAQHYSDGTKIPVAIIYNGKINNNEENNLNFYGRLYDWASATHQITETSPMEGPTPKFKVRKTASSSETIQGACPEGWRLPTIEEYYTLIGIRYDANDLKSTDNWLDQSGTNNVGMNIRPGGMFNALTNQFENLGGRAYLHVVGTLSSESTVKHIVLSCGCPDVLVNECHKDDALSIRCVKDIFK